MSVLIAATSPFAAIAPTNPVSEKLPDAPEAANDGQAATQAATPGSGPLAPHHTMVVSAGWNAQPITAKDKVYMGVRDVFTFTDLAGVVISAGYSQITDGLPNYGVNEQAFGQRLGATAIRSASQSIFSTSVFAPLLHEDPRYYVEGPQYSFGHRVLHAAFQPIVSRTDSGHRTINGELILGYAAAAALTAAYYPQANRNFRDVASTFGGSLGGAAIGFGWNEFSDQVLVAFHLKKPE